MIKNAFIILFISVAAVIMAGPASAGIVEAWTARYNGPAGGMDLATDQALDASGNIYVTGFSDGGATDFDYATVRLDRDGIQLWASRYDGNGGYDAASALVTDAAGNVAVTGHSLGDGAGYDYATIKYDANGNELWTARYNGPDNNSDYAMDIAMDAVGNVIVTGYSFGGDSGYDYATIKYDGNGNELWTARYSRSVNSSDYATAVVTDAAGNIYVTGFSHGENDYDFATVAYDGNGRQIWVARYNGPDDRYDAPSAIALDAAGNVYVTGQSMGNGSDDYATVKYTPAGQELWTARYNGPTNGYDAASAIALDMDGNVYVLGTSAGGNDHTDYATVKYSPTGEALWVARYNGPHNDFDEAVALAIDAAGNAFVTGSSEYTDNVITVKYDRSGKEVWVAHYSGQESRYDSAAALSVDPKGNVFVTGCSNDDYTTVKYIPVLGSVIEYEYTYFVPYFNARTNYWTGIGLKNGSFNTEATVQIVIHHADGSIQGIENIIIPPGGQHSDVVGKGLSGEGWLRIGSDQPLFGLSFIGTETAENYMADIPFANECATEMELPHVAQGPVYDTAVMVCNPGDQEAEVTLTFVDTNGRPVYETSKQLPASGSWNYPLAKMVPNPSIPNKGSIEISSTEPITAFGLYNNLKTGGYCYAGINGVAPGIDTSREYDYIIPYFNAQANYWTGLGLKNGNLQAEAAVEIVIHHADGSIQGKGDITLPPGGQHATVVGKGMVHEGWMRIRSNQPLFGLSFIGTESAENYMADIPFATECATEVELPHVAQGPVYDTIVMVCNPSDRETIVTLTFVDADGTALYEASQVLPAFGSWKYRLAEMVPDPSTPNKGTIEISSTEPVAAFGLYNNLKAGGYCFAGINGVNRE